MLIQHLLLDEVAQSSLKHLVKEAVMECLQSEKNTSADTHSKELLSSEQVMELLNIKRTTLHSYINKGVLKPIKLGNKNLFSKNDIEDTLLNASKKAFHSNNKFYLTSTGGQK